MESINIRKAVLSDIDNIIEFIKEHYYQKNHVFTRNKELFYSWHVRNDDVWFIIAEGTESCKLYGMLGYTLYSDCDNSDISLAMFQTIKSGDPSLGIEIIRYLMNYYQGSCVCSSGIVKSVRGLYSFLGYQVGALRHYYRLSDKDQYSIAKIEKKIIPPAADTGYTLRLFNTMQEVDNNTTPEIYGWAIPRKTPYYVQHKFFDNLGYQYKVYGIFNCSNRCVGLLTGREIRHNGAKCFKIVDYIGNDEQLRYVSFGLQKLLENNDYEYIDFYETGIPDEIMTAAGFVFNDKSDNIIPHYFEPFLLDNIDIYYCTTQGDKFHAYRSDGGQERPNYLDYEGNVL